MKRALLTGSSGFLGAYLKRALEQSQYEVDDVNRSAGFYVHDLSNGPFKVKHQYETIVHNAGLAHSPKAEDYQYFDINYEGTKHLVESLVEPPKCFVFISTIAVYGLEVGEGIDEGFPLKGLSPYAQSKIKAEQFLQEWAAKNDIHLYIFRLPLVVGENPPGNLGKMIKAIRKGFYFSVNDGKARRSMVQASDVAELVARIENQPTGIYNLCDGEHPSYKEMQDLIVDHFKARKPLSLPVYTAKLFGRIGDILPVGFPVNSGTIEKLNSSLTIDDTKARSDLNWRPRSVIKNFKGF